MEKKKHWGYSYLEEFETTHFALPRIASTYKPRL